MADDSRISSKFIVGDVRRMGVALGLSIVCDVARIVGGVVRKSFVLVWFMVIDVVRIVGGVVRKSFVLVWFMVIDVVRMGIALGVSLVLVGLLLHFLSGIPELAPDTFEEGLAKSSSGGEQQALVAPDTPEGNLTKRVTNRVKQFLLPGIPEPPLDASEKKTSASEKNKDAPEKNSADRVTEWMQQLPTLPMLYVLIAMLAGVCFGWRWRLYAKFCRDFKNRKDTKAERRLTPGDWQVVRELYVRAFALRTRADVILGGVFALLFGGIYFTVFITPEIKEIDYRSREEVREETQQDPQQELFQKEFGNTLQLIGKGLYWFKVAKVGAPVEDSSTESSGRTQFKLPVINIYKPDKNEQEEERVILVVNLNTAFVTWDGGKNWSKPEGLELKPNERIPAAAFGPDGRYGVVVGTRDSVFVTEDGGKRWSKSEGLELKPNERIPAAMFGAEGRNGVVVGDEGSVFVTEDGGKRWSKPKDLKLEPNERIPAAAFGAEGRRGVVVGDEGSAFVTEDGGNKWSKSEGLELKSNERIIVAAFSENGWYGVVVGDKGSVFVTEDSGKQWGKPEDLELEYERIIAAAFAPDGRGVVVGTRDSVFVTEDGGRQWRKPKDLKLKPNERIPAAAFSENGRYGVVVGDEGSVFMTEDSGKQWRKPEGLELKEAERIPAVAFGADGYGVVVGDKGSAFVTKDAGKHWISTETDQQDVSFRDVVSVVPGGQNYVAIDTRGGVHILKAYPDIAELEGKSLAEIQYFFMKKASENLRKSAVGQNIANFGSKEAVDTGKKSAGNGKKTIDRDKDIFSGFVDEVTITRLVTMFVLVLLAHTLVRLYQYSLRLAAFWDSRADAVLLAQSFADRSGKVAFDDLVHVLAPDAYDFKPQPGPGYETLLNLFRRQKRGS